MFKRVLVSVSDKTNLIELITPIFKGGAEIISTGGTAKYLRDHNITVKDVSEITDFPEILGGRVKTLHPKVHMSILARADHKEDMQTLEKYQSQLFDLVVCNLYPFEQKLNSECSVDELIENIDIGGVTLLRAAAKNFKSITVLCDPKDYSLAASSASDLNFRKKMAIKAFTHTAFYDSLIAQGLSQHQNLNVIDDIEKVTLGLKKKMKLRYGENAQQQASWYYFSQGEGIHSAEILQGKELSYNNLIDLNSALGVVIELKDAAAVGIKHTNPCGVGTGASISQAVERMISSDPKSIFGGIIAVNRSVDKASAEKLSEVFLECIIAPDFTNEALSVFSAKKNLRLLKWPNLRNAKMSFEAKSIYGGMLIQQSDEVLEPLPQFVYHGETPTQELLKDILMGISVCKWLKSNAIAIVKDGMTIGLGMGQVNRVDAVEQAIQRWKKFHPQIENPILISDGFFPFSDSITLAANFGIKWIIQPGGSVKDNEVIAEAKQRKVNLVLTGQRHFKH